MMNYNLTIIFYSNFYFGLTQCLWTLIMLPFPPIKCPVPSKHKKKNRKFPYPGLDPYISCKSMRIVV